MAARTSFYRPTGQSRRTNTRQLHDHDVFEGLPIRRWSKQWIWIANPKQPAPPPPSSTHDLPLPKDTHLLTPMSQTLLQAARNGTLTKPPEEPKPEEEDTDSHRLFLTSKWTVAPRDKEPPEVEYLAKITRGLKRKVNGKFIDIEEEDVVIGGTPGLDGMMLAQTPNMIRRRPPPPRRKPGKGRKAGFKKMVTFAEDGRALPAGEVGIAAPPDISIISSITTVAPSNPASIVTETVVESTVTTIVVDDQVNPETDNHDADVDAEAEAEVEVDNDADVEMGEATTMPHHTITSPIHSPAPPAPVLTTLLNPLTAEKLQTPDSLDDGEIEEGEIDSPHDVSITAAMAERADHDELL